MAASDTVGFVGLGIMGSRQAANLAKAGYELTVFNRTRGRAEEWAAEHGGHVAGSPREVAERSDVVITMVVDGAQVEQMLFGDDGALSGARPGTLCGGRPDGCCWSSGACGCCWRAGARPRRCSARSGCWCGRGTSIR